MGDNMLRECESTNCKDMTFNNKINIKQQRSKQTTAKKTYNLTCSKDMSRALQTAFATV